MRQWRWKNNIEEYQKKHNWGKHKLRIWIKRNSWRKELLHEDIKQSELIRKKHKKNYNILNYTDHLLLSASTATECVSISSFAFLVGILVRIASSAAW